MYREFTCFPPTFIFLIFQDPSSPNNIPKVKYQSLVQPKPSTRGSSSEPCECSICLLARATLHQDKDAIRDELVEDPPQVEAAQQPSKKPDVLKMCLTCGSQIGKGLPHKCTKGQFSSNALKLVKDNSRNTKGRITANLVRDHFNEDGGWSQS